MGTCKCDQNRSAGSSVLESGATLILTQTILIRDWTWVTRQLSSLDESKATPKHRPTATPSSSVIPTTPRAIPATPNRCPPVLSHPLSRSYSMVMRAGVLALFVSVHLDGTHICPAQVCAAPPVPRPAHQQRTLARCPHYPQQRTLTNLAAHGRRRWARAMRLKPEPVHVWACGRLLPAVQPHRRTFGGRQRRCDHQHEPLRWRRLLLRRHLLHAHHVLFHG